MNQQDQNNAPKSGPDHHQAGFIEEEKDNEEPSILLRQPKLALVRSQSECQLRDKEFYEMCDDEDEVVLYCKMADQIHEQTIMDQVNEI